MNQLMGVHATAYIFFIQNLAALGTAHQSLYPCLPVFFALARSSPTKGLLAPT